MNRVKCEFGDLRFEIFADEDLANLFYREFAARDMDEKAQLFLYIEQGGGQLIRQAFEERFGEIRREPDYETRTARFWFLDGSISTVFVEARQSPRARMAARLPAILHRFLSKRFLDRSETAYVNILYGAVLWVVFLNLIVNRRLVLHASAITLNGVTVAFCGFGGAGKTTLSGWFIGHRSADFISDDLLSIGSGGAAQPSGMFVHVYPYNAMEDRIWGSMSIIRKIHWSFRKYFFGEKGVCARIAPASIYSHICLFPRAMDAVIWLRRSSGPLTLRDADIDLFVEEHLTVLEREMYNAFEFEKSAAGSAITGAVFPCGLKHAVKECLDTFARQTTVLKLEGGDGKEISANAEAISKALAARFGKGGEVEFGG